MLIEEMVRTIEILSVAPAFLRGMIDKQNYLKRLREGEDLQHLIPIFLQTSEKHLFQSKITPAGYYTGVWCRDASYILNELLQMGRIDFVGTWLEWIWNHRLGAATRTVYGRGSPETGYRLRRADEEYVKKFGGSLPSSIQYSYCEVFAKSPDIDSTALMISSTCKFLCLLDDNSGFTERLLPRIRDAIIALEKRDADGDSLLEQGPNEDWMDNMLRSGKVVYSQAAWAIALRDWQVLLTKVKNHKEADTFLEKYDNVVKQVNVKLWHNSSYYADEKDHAVDEKVDQQNVEPVCMTQDVSLFLLLDNLDEKRVLSTLDTIRTKLWKESGVACAVPSARTGPHKLRPYHYQNGGFWPWITSIEILARLKLGHLQESKILLEKAILYAPFEWIHPYTRQSGSYPFKTGIAAVRTAVREFSKNFR